MSKMYPDVSFRLDELIDAYALVYSTDPRLTRVLESSKNVRLSHDIQEATWFISRTDAPQFSSAVSAFASCDGIADFALIGPSPDVLPSNCHVTLSEEYGPGEWLTLGKKVA